MREIKKIIIHCSDSATGSAHLINKWHIERGWDEIGYHFVINNGAEYPILDGMIEVGRDIKKIGAHCFGQNRDSIGICLIGTDNFTIEQYRALILLCLYLFKKYNLTWKDVYGHYELNKDKTCPNIDMDLLRRSYNQHYPC